MAETVDEKVKRVLSDYKKMTIVGLSPDASKPSQGVPVYMRAKGYDPVGIYPGETEINGIKIYPSLSDVPKEYRRFVDVFRKNEAIPRVVDEVLAVGGVEVLWLQLGITHPEAEKRAEAAGITVISNRCLIIEHRRFF